MMPKAEANPDQLVLVEIDPHQLVLFQGLGEIAVEPVAAE